MAAKPTNPSLLEHFQNICVFCDMGVEMNGLETVKHPRKWLGSKIEIAVFAVGFLSCAGYVTLNEGYANNLVHFINLYFPNIFFSPKDYHADTYLILLYGSLMWFASLVFLILGIWKRYSLAKNHEQLSRLGIIGCLLTGVYAFFPAFVLLFVLGTH